MKKYYFSAALVSLCLASSGCNTRPLPSGDSNTLAAVKGDEPAAVEIGEFLFAPAEFTPTKPADRTHDPITIPLGHATIREKQDLPSQVDGKVVWVGVETNPAEIAEKKLTPNDLYIHPRDKKTYRRMKPGDYVKRDQPIVFLDDRQAYVEMTAAETKLSAAKAEVEGYRFTVDQLDKIVKSYERGLASSTSAVAPVEYYNNLATKARYQADLINREGQAKIAESDFAKYELQLQKHVIRAEFDGQVQQIAKFPGESVRANDPILVIQNPSRLRIEANMPKEYLSQVSGDDAVTIETPRDIPYGTTFEQHTTNRTITKVTVAVVDGKPMIVSAGDDGEVYVWNKQLNVQGTWKFRSSVKSLAVTRPGADPLLVIGTDDGIARIYDLSNISREPMRVLDGKHEGGVNAASFSPDGKWLVTADERNIHLWEVSTGKKKYSFGAREHHSAITALHFTPQCRVVSVAKEPSVRVWTLGEKAARVEQRIDSRTGDVVQLGISPDGSRLLVDADKTRFDIVHLQEGRKERPIVTAGESARFQTFAIISPNQLVATAGITEGVVQLWKAPTATERASEWANFICKNNAQPTCAVFSPLEKDPFLVVGTKKGEVHLWDLSKADEFKSEIRANVTHVENMIDSSGKNARVLVDIENPRRDAKYTLRPGSSVTVIIRPKQP